MIRVSHELDRSVSEVVNVILSTVTAVDIKEVVSLKPKPTEEMSRPAKRVFRRSNSWPIRP